jgi:hypothetical protein
MITFRPYAISRPSFGHQPAQEQPIHAFLILHGLKPWQQKKLQEWEAQGVITSVKPVESGPDTVAISLAPGQDLAKFIEKVGDAWIGIVTPDNQVAFKALKALTLSNNAYTFATAFP